MLIPQFSVRWALAVTAAFGVFFLFVALARDGSTWAAAVAIAIGSVAVVLLIHAGMFFLVWLFSLLPPLAWRRRGAAHKSPFRPL